ncbi:substance-P receptor-like isoform X2 [Centruroides sculpturatus]|uniref:substance-P receptor-like isoform X2 n=1 Tax=Centruroides sculpturatus TaxID=218467 RepID=UPI000C6D8C12|nr:substance-P receptor-like isoform X2 [Centruroides sculpturatus]
MDLGCKNFSEVKFWTNHSFPADKERVLVLFDYLRLTVCCILIFWTIGSNLFVVLAGCFEPSLKNTTGKFLVNLATADIFIAVFCMMIHIVRLFQNQHQYQLGPIMCKFEIFSKMTCLTASVLTLSAISCDRFIAIMFPLHVRITKQRTSAVITVIWIVSMLAAIPFPIYRTHVERQWSDFLEIQCSDVWPHEVVYSEELGRCIKLVKGKKIYYTFVTIALFFLPIVIMSTTYSLIVRRLWMSELPGERSTSNINIQHRAKKKVIKMVCVVLAVFVLCWMPLQIIVLYSQFGHKDAPLPEWFLNFNYFATFAAYSNSALNPIIYGGFNNNFRQAFLKLLKCSYRRRTFERPRSATQRSTTSLLFWKFSKNKTVSTFRLSS